MITANMIADYFVWAEDVLLQISSTLSQEEFLRDLGHGGNLFDIYYHLATDHVEWYQYVTGDELYKFPENKTDLNGKDLLSIISETNLKWKKLAEKRPFEIVEIKEGENKRTLILGELIFHINNHAAYHRGQIALALRILGKEVKMTDYVPYLWEKD